MSERKKHIAVLKEMLEWMNMSSEVIKKDDPFFIVHEHRKKAVKYAISSLETDEAYQLEYEPTTKNDLALIHTWGLDEEIRCTMCTNSMKSDRGCDGSCVVNKGMYKAVMDAIEKRIHPTTKNDLSSGLEKNSKKLEKDFGELDCISRADVNRIICEYRDDATKTGNERDLERAYGANAVGELISELPPVTPIRPKGHWIKGYTFPDGEYWKCDKCNELIKVKYPMYYCNNCGSDNREVEE